MAKLLKKVFVIVILAFLFLTGIYVIFKKQTSISYVENREYVTNQELLASDFSSGEFQANLDSLLADQIPDRFSFVMFKNKVEYQFVNLFYHFLKNPLLLNPIGDSNINQIGNSNILMTEPLKYNEEWENRIKARIDQINDFASDYPDLNVYVYHPTQISETSFLDEANGLTSAGLYYESLFKNLKVPYDQFDLNSFDDYPNYFYYSDHHWNNRGSYKGYVDIANLMGIENVLKPLAENCHDGLTFSGTYSSQSGFVTEAGPFCVYQFDLPDYSMDNLDGPMEISNTNTFFNAEIKQSLDYYYNIAYKVGDGYTHLHNDSGNGKLLIIGDSYAGPILPLLINNYQDIYFVYPINYKSITKEDFIYDTFIEENDIDDLLIMYTIENYFTSDEWGPRYLDFDIKREEE